MINCNIIIVIEKKNTYKYQLPDHSINIQVL